VCKQSVPFTCVKTAGTSIPVTRAHFFTSHTHLANIWQKKAAREALNYIKDLLGEERKKV